MHDAGESSKAALQSKFLYMAWRSLDTFLIYRQMPLIEYLVICVMILFASC